mmetsp:Transcript_5831/g.19840  ORF Transcript_5831/g.19840 Transcript_5831/m.19840 type:complete len:293 (+) Transcript_5831:1053-1931(+)
MSSATRGGGDTSRRTVVPRGITTVSPSVGMPAASPPQVEARLHRSTYSYSAAVPPPPAGTARPHPGTSTSTARGPWGLSCGAPVRHTMDEADACSTAQGTPPIETVASPPPPSRRAPATVTRVPPAVEPLAGNTEDTSGVVEMSAVKTPASTTVELPTPRAATSTTCAPSPSSPGMQTTRVGVDEIRTHGCPPTVTLLPSCPPTVTLSPPSPPAASRKPLPSMVRGRPPPALPTTGWRAVIRSGTSTGRRLDHPVPATCKRTSKAPAGSWATMQRRGAVLVTSQLGGEEPLL